MECAETLFEFLVIGEEIITEAREPEKIKTSV